MSRITLTQFADSKGQTKAAKLLGMTQGALNKALRVGRDIYVTELPDGSFQAEEVRPFPSQAQPKKTAA
ncbi:Cro/CI family transcriptional regulator [Pseudomonas asplenii]|nr:Cro/CI family transcriptional regulator [Pseudomonas fuscovaginae]